MVCCPPPPLNFFLAEARAILASKNWKQAFRRSDLKVPFMWWECRKVICSVFTQSDFQNWPRICNLAPKRSQWYHAKFVGAFHVSRRVSDENRACSITIRFPKLRIRVGRSSSMCSHYSIFGTNKNRILKNGSPFTKIPRWAKPIPTSGENPLLITLGMET